MRDLGRVDPWQESLERSLARRGKLPRSAQAEHDHRSAHAEHVRPSDRRRSELAHPEDRIDRRPPPRTRTRTDDRRRRRRVANRPGLLAIGSWGILALAVIMVTVGGLIDGHGAQASADHTSTPGHTSTRIAHAHVTALRPSPAGATLVANQAPSRAIGGCRPVPKSSGYVNPLAGDTLIGERIDQGVDYAGTGKLSAIGPAKITYVGTSATGWPGAFIEYRLLAGPDTGCFIYYAEGINPVGTLRPGQHVRAGQVLAHIIPGWATGIELGWGSGSSTKTFAEKSGRWTATDDADSIASGAGKSFSSLISALGGPAGRVEG